MPRTAVRVGSSVFETRLIFGVLMSGLLASAPASADDAAKTVSNSRAATLTTAVSSPTPPAPRPPRAVRPFALSGALGWNSLAGFALGATYSFDPHVSADWAIGVGAIGFKTGARVRYNVFEGRWTPSFGVGIQYGPGSRKALDVQNTRRDESALVLVEESAYVQTLAAMSYQGSTGFTALFGVGYSVLLDKDNVRHLAGSKELADQVRFITGSGIVFEGALGYAF